MSHSTRLQAYFFWYHKYERTLSTFVYAHHGMTYFRGVAWYVLMLKPSSTFKLQTFSTVIFAFEVFIFKIFWSWGPGLSASAYLRPCTWMQYTMYCYYCCFSSKSYRDIPENCMHILVWKLVMMSILAPKLTSNACALWVCSPPVAIAVTPAISQTSIC